LERLLKIYPDHLNAHSYLGYAYLAAGDIDRAIQHQEVVVQNQNAALDVRLLAESYNHKGLYQKAEDACRLFLQDIEDIWIVRRMLIYSYSCQRQLDLALAEAEKNYLLNPDTRSDLGTVLVFKDDLAGAEKMLGHEALLLNRGKFNENVNVSRRNLEKSKGSKADEAGAYGGLTTALEKAGRYEEAYQAFSQYLRLSAEDRKSGDESGLPYLPSREKEDLSIKGRIQAEMKSFHEANKTAEELKSVIEKGINRKELRYHEYILGLIELGKNNPRKAADIFKSACGRLDFQGEFSTEQASSFDNLARALYESGDLDKSRNIYEKITLLTTGRRADGDLYAKAYYMLGKIADQKGEKTHARDYLQRFLALWKDADPGLPEVADAKRRLASL
jgi:tetratricopeptide (TPR) repeat protein